MLHQVGEEQRGRSTHAHQAVDHDATATVHMLMDLVCDWVEVRVNGRVWRVVEEDLHRLDVRSVVLFGQLLCAVHQQRDSATVDVLFRRAVRRRQEQVGRDFAYAINYLDRAQFHF